MLCLYVQSFKSVVKLKVISFKDKFPKHKVWTPQFQLQTSHVLFHTFEPLSPASRFLLLNSVSYVPRNNAGSFSLNSFSNSFPLFQFLCHHFSFLNIYLWSSCFLSLSLLITTYSGLPGNVLISLFLFHISPLEIPPLSLSTISCHIYAEM